MYFFFFNFQGDEFTCNKLSFFFSDLSLDELGSRDKECPKTNPDLLVELKWSEADKVGMLRRQAGGYSSSGRLSSQ